MKNHYETLGLHDASLKGALNYATTLGVNIDEYK
jgi:hypothetical protein